MNRYKNLLKIKKSSNENRIFSKSLIISEAALNKTFLVYNGKEFKKIVVDRSKIGFKIGEFLSTKKHTRKLKVNKKNKIK